MKVDYKKEELILSVKDVSLTYDGPQILDGINMDIHNVTRPGMVQGQIISIVGRSGCGKSSLFKLLSGYNTPTSGEIKVGVEQANVIVGEMGVVPQDYPLFNHRTVMQNLSLALSSLKGKEKLDTINDYAAHFELTEELKKFPCDLSGGQRQRVSILQQVLAGNRFILLDEPFSGLDPLMKDKVIELLIKVANLDEMNTLIIVSHDIESSCAISDTVFVLANKTGNGSTVVKTYDFLEEGLAYQADVKEDPRFRAIIQEIKTLI
jgi:ABC-type nitrate/sulfonate/bicarbonate transport system ATPase subunit